MPIAAATRAFVQHLRHRLEAGPGGLGGWSVEAMTLGEARGAPPWRVGLVLWRAQPDEPAGGRSALRDASRGDPPEGIGTRLRYLLLVHGESAEAEQVMLGRCMAELDAHPVIADPEAPEAISAMAVVVAVETPPDDEYLRLGALLGDPPPLLVPYAVRTVQLRPPVAGRIPDPSAEGAAPG